MVSANLVQNKRLLGEDGDIPSNNIDIGGDEINDSARVDKLRLQPMLQKSRALQKIRFSRIYYVVGASP